MARYDYKPFDYVAPPELSGKPGRRWPVVIVGAGPIGLTAAIDLALHGIESLVLDDNNVVSVGSRAICWAKRSLEIFDRLGVGERMLEKGVTWQVGRLFHGDNEVYNFDLLPEPGHKMPAFINLQQYYVEQYLVERAGDLADRIELRWNNRVCGLEQDDSGTQVKVETPDGFYEIKADYVLACDGARSPIRSTMDLDFDGEMFEERFLICDVEMKADFPSERWFWFEPPFHNGQSALLHKQPDDIYRIDLQLGPDADPDEERKPENVIPRIKAMVGDRPFEIDWVSVYTFQCRRIDRFVHDRVIFVGDSAHIVSPFGARGGNGGVQDVDNLVWKLAAVLNGKAGPQLLESYNHERIHGCDENLRNSSRATSFMTPKSDMEKLFRDAVLDLASDLPFARKLVNSGRLSQPCSLERFAPTKTDARADGLMPGEPCLDAPIINGTQGWLLNQLGGDFTIVSFDGDASAEDGGAKEIAGIRHIRVSRSPAAGPQANTLIDRDGIAIERYGAGLSYLIRPDQHIAARFEEIGKDAVREAHARALSGELQ